MEELSAWNADLHLVSDDGGVHGCGTGANSASIIENLARCNDFERFSYEGFSGLRTASSNDEKLSIARRAAVTKFNVGGQDNVLWEYRFTQPIRVLGLSAIGVGNSVGMPALAVAFDAPLDSIKSARSIQTALSTKNCRQRYNRKSGEQLQNVHPIDANCVESGGMWGHRSTRRGIGVWFTRRE